MKFNLVFLLAVIVQVNAFDISKDNITQDLIIYEGQLEAEMNKSTKGIVTFASVGNGATCSHTTIQPAIDSGVDEVRIVHDHVYNEDITIPVRDVVIRGDYATCEAANSNLFAGTANAIIEGTGSGQAVVKIVPVVKNSSNDTKGGGATPLKITLINLEIRGGTGGFTSGGGIHMSQDAVVDLTIYNSNIHNNTSSSGGGISIKGESDVLISGSSISNNSASYGGGIYCNNPNARISMFENAITQNSAVKSAALDNGKGGGIYMSNQCQLKIYHSNGSSDVSFNQSGAQGGGIYVESGAHILLEKLIFCDISGACIATAPLVAGNVSDSDHTGNENGGGIFVTGTGSLVTIKDAYIAGNNAGGHGGAISVENGAVLRINQSRNGCWNKSHCVFFQGNKAGEQSFGAGGAIFNSASTVYITNAVFEENRADFGTVIYATGLNSLTTINGSIFNHNGAGGGNSGATGFSDNNLIMVLQDAVGHVLSSTIADNNVTLGVLKISNSTTASSTVYSSIIHDATSGNVFASGSTGYLTDCNIVHETASFISSGTSSVNNPMFVDSANRDYHIQTSSPAVDGCDNFNNASDYVDIDNDIRGYDDPNQADTLGPFDIGADETIVSDIIFADGFE